jgi:hypothetical protein
MSVSVDRRLTRCLGCLWLTREKSPLHWDGRDDIRNGDGVVFEILFEGKSERREVSHKTVVSANPEIAKRAAGVLCKQREHVTVIGCQLP